MTKNIWFIREANSDGQWGHWWVSTSELLAHDYRQVKVLNIQEILNQLDHIEYIQQLEKAAEPFVQIGKELEPELWDDRQILFSQGSGITVGQCREIMRVIGERLIRSDGFGDPYGRPDIEHVVGPPCGNENCDCNQ